jgi:hypothetical protein
VVDSSAYSETLELLRWYRHLPLVAWAVQVVVMAWVGVERSARLLPSRVFTILSRPALRSSEEASPAWLSCVDEKDAAGKYLNAQGSTGAHARSFRKQL